MTARGSGPRSSPDGPLATPEDLAEFLNDIPVKTLAQWRYRGIGPKYRKVGRHVRYDWADIHAWLARQCPDRTWA
jgi:hypothetical protein